MDMSLDEHDARRLAARILMEPGWQAKLTSRDGPATRPAGGYVWDSGTSLWYRLA